MARAAFSQITFIEMRLEILRNFSVEYPISIQT